MTDKTSRMPLPDGLTEEAILAAIADYRVRGSREAFLEHHGIRKGATSYCKTHILLRHAANPTPSATIQSGHTDGGQDVR